MRNDTIRSIVRAYDDPVVRAYCWARFLVLRQRFLEEIGQYLPPSGPVLDIGCGFGLFSLYYAATGPGRFVRGLDLSARRIAMARRAAGRLGLENVAYEVGDARDFKGDAEVSAAYMLDIVHHVPPDTVPPLLAQLRRCLAPGGLLLVKDVDTRPAPKRWFTWTLDRLMAPRTPVRYWSTEELTVALEVHAGEIVGVIGPNGAGKSTAFKTIVGFLRPRRGRVIFNGQEITGVRPDLVLRRGLAYVPQGRIVFPQMTVLENLEMGAYIDRDRTRVTQALDQVYTLFPILRERRRQKAGTMSGGEQQMVAIGRALMTSPTLILLDEPSLGLSPKFVTLIFEKLVEMKDAGFTLMLVEQNAARALAIADRGYVLELGRNHFEGAGQRLLADPEVKRLYLGG